MFRGYEMPCRRLLEMAHYFTDLKFCRPRYSSNVQGLYLYTVSQIKRGHFSFRHNFYSCWAILKILLYVLL